jgi:hypothetical protein
MAFRGNYSIADRDTGSYQVGDLTMHNNEVTMCCEASSTSTQWVPIATCMPPPAIPAPLQQNTSFAIVQTFATPDDLVRACAGPPLPRSMMRGDLVLVTSTSGLYMWNGAGYDFVADLASSDGEGFHGSSRVTGAVGPAGDQGDQGHTGLLQASRLLAARAPAPAPAPALGCKFPVAFAETPLADGDDTTPACQICLAHKTSACIVDCGHANYCVSCLQGQARPTCPSCNVAMTHVVRIYQ